ncbi:hypothetical protein ABC383_15715 [Noviherbaspirillum sp. 1P10PC]|uniref:hypothetical protein n=1 Tax=Noviherbaspirillum sp. 1P10PC TaxID=3132292 RepID=UPI0039A22D52
MNNTNNIHEKLNLSFEELYAELATGLSKGASPGDLIKRGKEIYENLREKLHDKICLSDAVHESFSRGDKVLLVAALVDCVSGAITGISPVTFCVLLAKEGVSTLCATEWSKKSDE